MATATLTKEQMKRIREALKAPLEAAGKTAGVELKLGNATFDPAGFFTFKLEGKLPGGLTREATAYIQNAGWMGLPPLGTTFRHPKNDADDKITGMTSGGKVITERGSQKFVWKPENLKQCIAIAAQQKGA